MRATTIALGLAIAMGLALGADDRPIVAERVRQLTRDAAWTRVADVPVQFRTYHPQGMVKVGDEFYISSVEVRVPTKRYPAPIDGHDRDTGEGIGHLFKMDRRGRLIADLRLGAGSVYHPGGIDFDGKDIWVPVSEYRPDSRSIIYKVSPARPEAGGWIRLPSRRDRLRRHGHLGARIGIPPGQPLDYLQGQPGDRDRHGGLRVSGPHRGDCPQHR
jgi:hypothetical protein